MPYNTVTNHLLRLADYVEAGLVTEYERPNGTTTYFPATGFVMIVKTGNYYGMDIGRVQSVDIDVEGNASCITIDGDGRSLGEDAYDEDTWGLHIEMTTASEWYKEERRELVHSKLVHG